MSYDTKQTILVGRLTRDPEVAYTKQNTPVVKFSIASNRRKDEVNFFDIVAWDKLADTCSKFLQKGRQVIVTGRLQQSRFQDKNGQNRSKVEIVANNVQFIGGGAENGSQGSQEQYQSQGGQGNNVMGGPNTPPVDNFGRKFDDFDHDPMDPF